MPRGRIRRRMAGAGIALVVLAMLAACGSSAQVGSEVVVRDVGLVLLTEVDEGGDRWTSARGTFSKRNEPVALVSLHDPFGDDRATCHVGDAASAGSTGAGSPLSDGNGEPLEAGDVLTVHRDGAALMSLAETSAGTYETASNASIALPDGGLSLDVPGARFPAFGDAAFAATEPFAFAPGLDPSSVSGTSVLSWDADPAESSVVLIVGVDGDAVFSCVAPDTGTFRFDAATQTALADAGYVRGAIAFAGRLSLQAHVQADAVLLLGVLRARSPAPLVPASTAPSPHIERVLASALDVALR